ncbi:MAG: ABC-F family ATP-binding cassette domain-containing protein [Verrucomicrobia bacterium]|nr:MAG: ABC-F family ATP-binding cassette domain-containing protein [Verrucomicrobiota bacterium]
MFTLSTLAKGFGGRTLFSDVSLTINRTDRLGLVGPNGAGKSTLFKILLGDEEPDEGMVTRQRGATVGFLPQESAPVGEETVIEIATGQLHHLDHHIVDGPDIAKAKRILKGLSFREEDFDRPARELSGGWVMRTHLARLLVQEPDLLMLDEPTNHLDLETLLWFQEYLRGYPGGIVVISHDREFLNRLVTGILELRGGRLWRFTGNYDDYLEKREAQEEQQLAAFKNQQKEIGRLMDFVSRFRAKASTATRAQAKLKQIERMDRVDAPEAAAATVGFAFPQPESSGHRVLTLRKVDFAYGAHSVYAGLDFETTKGDRIVLVGPNGAGKSTLIKLLAGVLTPQAGERDLGIRVKAGYYSQYRTEMLQAERTVLAEALDTPARVTELYVRTLLGCFLFKDDDVFKKVSVLSGGEKSRLALVRILLDPPNLLLMDEPTTHLDMASIDALVAALSEYTGTLVFISHDVYFIRALATKVLHVHSGRLTPYSGDYDYYLEKTRASSARVALTAPVDGRPVGKPTNGRPAGAARAEEVPDAAKVTQKDRKQQAAEMRKMVSAQKRAVVNFENWIAAAEKRQQDFTAELERSETYSKPGRVQEINQSLRTLAEEIERLNTNWEAAATRLAELEAQPGETA